MRAILRKKMQVGNRGFSLIELMVVVAIIGILATLAIPSVQGFIGRARQSEARTNLSQLYTVVTAYAIDPVNISTPAAGGPGIVGMGFRPEAALRYNIGFIGTGGAENTAQICDGSLPTGVTGINCSNVPGTGGTLAAPATAYPDMADLTGRTWVAGAIGVVSGTSSDVWTMNAAKTLSNTTIGL